MVQVKICPRTCCNKGFSIPCVTHLPPLLTVLLVDSTLLYLGKEHTKIIHQ